jgi:NAD(P)H-hydrate epimerase
MNDALWRQLLHRPVEANKYDFGHVLVVGGSPNMTGAPLLAARAALRVGAGLVTIASTADTTALLDRDVEESMTLTLPDWKHEHEVIAALSTFISQRHVSVVIIGPGLPPNAEALVRDLLVKLRLPAVLDAFCFTALSGHLKVLEKAAAQNENLVLTPHTGEFERLVSAKLPSHKEQRIAAQEFAKEYGVTVALKGSHTFVAGANGEHFENQTGNPGLATAGSGDVLTGCIAGIVAQHIAPYDAAVMGVYIHGMAGDLAAKAKTEPGMIASDIIEELPAALSAIQRSLT